MECGCVFHLLRWNVKVSLWHWCSCLCWNGIKGQLLYWMICWNGKKSQQWFAEMERKVRCFVGCFAMGDVEVVSRSIYICVHICVQDSYHYNETFPLKLGKAFSNHYSYCCSESLRMWAATIWTNAGILLVGPKGTKLSENLIQILQFSFKNMGMKIYLQNVCHMVLASLCQKHASVSQKFRVHDVVCI